MEVVSSMSPTEMAQRMAARIGQNIAERAVIAAPVDGGVVRQIQEIRDAAAKAQGQRNQLSRSGGIDVTI
jgi:hypothetical protein